MADTPLAPVVRHIHKLVGLPQAGNRTDAHLLEQFVHQRDEGAFAALVRRHGPLVWRVCRRVLRHVQQAEEAYQATFLVLARQAGQVRKPASLASWLYGVAYRIARKTRADILRRQSHERESIVVPVVDPVSEVAWRELECIVVEEVHALAEKYRAPILLCYWEGLTNEETAHQLGWPAGTVKTRLLKARRLLHERLTRRGVSLSAGAFTTLLAVNAEATVPPIVAALGGKMGLSTGASASVSALAEGAVHGMTLAKVKLGLVLLLVTSVLAGGAALAAHQMMAARQAETRQTETKKPDQPTPPKEKEQARTDRYGDPLPPEAIARLGSLRLYHGFHVHRVTLSPDGKWVVSTAMDGNRLWDAVTGRERPLRQELREAAIFATRDKLVAVAKQNLDLQLWDVVSDKKIGGLLPAAKVGELPLYLHFGVGSGNGQCPLGLSPDGRTLVICNMDKRPVIRFCDVVRSQVEDPIPLKLDDRVQTQMAFSADSKTLVLQRVGKGHAKIHIWDMDRRTETIVSPSNTQDYSGQIALSPDGKILATVPFTYKGVRLWDTRTLKELPPLLKQPEAYMVAIAFSPDGKQLAVSHFHFGSLVRLYDLASRKEVRQFRGKGSQVFHLAYSADGKYLTAGDGAYITFWDATTGKFRHDHWHTSAINSVAFSPDGKRLVSGAARPDNIVRIWDPLTGKETAQLRGHKEGIAVVASSPDGKLIASAGEDKTIRLWDAATGREIRRLEAEVSNVYAMAFAPDGKMIASGGWKKAVQFWDVATGQELRSFANPGNWVSRLAFSADGKWLATHGAADNAIRLWDVAQGKQIHTLAIPPSRRSPLMAFSPDGKTVAASSNDDSVHLWDALSGEPRRPFAVPLVADRRGPVDSIAFSPDGRSLAAGYGFGSGHEGEGCLVVLWELSSRQVRTSYRRQGNISHWRGIRSLAFSPDSTLLATGGDDCIIMIWDLSGQRTTHFPRKGRLRLEEANALWSKLAEADAREAYRAVQTLLAAGEQAVSFLKQHLHPAPAIDTRRIDRLLADLDSDEFSVRQKAARELRAGRRRGVRRAEDPRRQAIGRAASSRQRITPGIGPRLLPRTSARTAGGGGTGTHRHTRRAARAEYSGERRAHGKAHARGKGIAGAPRQAASSQAVMIAQSFARKKLAGLGRLVAL